MIHAGTAAQRGQLWKALYELEQVRDRAIELRGLRENLETKHFRHVDQLPLEFLSTIQRSMPISLEREEIIRALRVATDCFTAEAVHLDTILNQELGIHFRRKLQHYLATFE